MEVSGQLWVPAALFLLNELPMAIELETRWAPETGWILWKKEFSVNLYVIFFKYHSAKWRRIAEPADSSYHS
jgi:hypothetical protein